MALSKTAIMHDRGKVPPEAGVTDRQAQVLSVVAELTCELGVPPTLREVMAEIGIRSPNGVMFHVRALQNAGMLDDERDKQSRGRLVLTERARRMFQGVTARWPYVRLRLLTPEVLLTPEKARRLAEQLLSLADQVENEEG